ncbi:Uncharacterized protein TCM_030399 [Theobroma cacao]|uniref:Uncharacterized protein n=1 Tax=Theobroma cacao TaxID=3641 RepID=A0A061GGC8_THECC|nr:Uncharacterized protein TCM_030399 [Theobroma cacao]
MAKRDRSNRDAFFRVVFLGRGNGFVVPRKGSDKVLGSSFVVGSLVGWFYSLDDVLASTCSHDVRTRKSSEETSSQDHAPFSSVCRGLPLVCSRAKQDLHLQDTCSMQ